MAVPIILRFARNNAMEPGLRFEVLWNGKRAGNGDGIPLGGAVDPDNPLIAEPVAIWPYGKAGDGTTPDGELPDGAVGNPDGMGDGAGADGVGEDGLTGDYVEWSSEDASPPLRLRDGTYLFAVRTVDSLGNRQETSPAEVEVVIACKPRPPRSVRMAGYAEGVLTIAWVNSLDLEHLAQ